MATSPDRNSLELIVTPGCEGYELLDSGGGRKLERFGSVIVDRPERQALWKPALGADRWGRAHAVFSASDEDEEKGRWRIDKAVPDGWPVDVLQARMICRLQGLWHIGLFPEQLPHWQWMGERIARVTARGKERPRVLNLFGYTGAASLIAAAQGAEVTHVDASKKAIGWAKENQSASKLENAPIRWMLDDAAKFVAREVRRGNTYHVILIDPPKFGRGPKNETWDLFQSLPGFLEDCSRLLAPENSAFILTVYAIRASALAFGQLAEQVVEGSEGRFSIGELAISPVHGGNAVPTSLFVRWWRDD
ncbi:SAM dependent methyltransferase [Candidatus Filomicrobium marinum]|uniref:SAM dependent methyltransferase n=2 Tax=Filomicrobium TaxID=119044 RepID=A0A0D6J9M9_9HYPH|nr:MULTISPECIES: class I SAM-dependent methyltransferase [Filomicrobium]CFW97552.1 SAM dependent methyltransferase [Candidatus Filomicrobium marinum]CPR14699.1 SAM dependent methyltransferase [Candidatus Filomicrobium marinum]SDO76887.1 23S rRNA (cytosine1962-C5)-methyltransferase [Filomicrobium insigne]